MKRLHPQESRLVNASIRRWLQLPEGERHVGEAETMATQLGISRDAFYQRVHRIRRRGI